MVDNGEEALALARQEQLRPVRARTSCCRAWTATSCAAACGRKTTVPVLFLSARDTELDKVVGLEIGGGRLPGQALRRARAHRPRPRASAPRPRRRLPRREPRHHRLGHHAGRGRPHRRRASTARSTSRPASSSCWPALMKNAGKVVSREDLLRDAWGWEYLTETKTVDTHIKRLRDKIRRRRLRSGPRGNGPRLRLPLQGVSQLARNLLP